MNGRRRNEAWKKLYRYGADLILFLLLLAEFEYVWRMRLNILLPRAFEDKGNLLMLAVYLIILVLLFLALGGLKIGSLKRNSVLLSQVLAAAIENTIQFVLLVLMVGSIYAIGDIANALILLTCANITTILFVTSFVMWIYRRIFPPYRMIQIYGSYENELCKKMNARPDKYRIVEHISCDEPLCVIQEKLIQYDAVLINDIPDEKRNFVLKYCFEKNIRVYFTPKISDIMVKRAEEINLFDTPLFLSRNLGINLSERAIKRVGDIVVSILLLVLLSPLMLFTAVCIHMEDGGPVFFTQERCTIDCKRFRIYKFRSMVVNAECEGKSRPAGEADDRITRVGKVIRATRIDELPQLINVLKGEMSLVGPRPERVEHVEKYCREVPEFAYRMKVKGGMTGYAQVYGKYNTSAYDKLKLDLLYIENFSLVLDLRIILMTIKVIFVPESTEGFSKEAIEKLENAK
jgi:exopolysaccharide biosynthesis polyprenyl glycosylphosphotransferase